MESINKTVQLEAARALVTALEADNENAIEHQLAILTQSQESELFHEVGKLTRELHNVVQVAGQLFAQVLVIADFEMS